MKGVIKEKRQQLLPLDVLPLCARHLIIAHNLTITVINTEARHKNNMYLLILQINGCITT